MNDERSAVTLVRIRPEDVVSPEDCACCGAAASRTQAARLWFQGRGLLVPYCAACHRHAAAAGTRDAAVALSAALATATAALGLPLLFAPPSLIVHLAFALLVGSVPWIAFALWPKKASAGHSSSGKAVYFRPNGTLVCRRAAWGERLARASGVGATRGRWLGEMVTPWLLATWTVSAAGSVLAYETLFPVVHVVNSTNAPFTVLVDGRARAKIESARSEGTFGTVALRVLAGHRSLAARDPSGRVLSDVVAEVGLGRDYLYAPASTGTCFWVETAGYGRTHDTTLREPLSSPSMFWVIEPRIDVWFSALPPRSADGRSSGGTLRAVRRAPCAEPSSASSTEADSEPAPMR